MRLVWRKGKRWVPEAVAVRGARFGDIGEGEIRNGIHGLERSVIYVGGMRGFNGAHSAGRMRV